MVGEQRGGRTNGVSPDPPRRKNSKEEIRPPHAQAMVNAANLR